MTRTTATLLAVLALAGAAHAQERDGIATLADGFSTNLTCGADALPTLRTRVRASTADKADIGDALRQISRRDSTCAQVRDAASNLVDELFRTPAAAAELGLTPTRAPPEVSAMIADAFREADRVSASRGFESPPPPRRLTRGRISTP